MKKKCLSGLVILITIILATYMIVNKKESKSSEYTMVKDLSNEGNNEIVIDDFLEKIEIDKGSMRKEENVDNKNTDKLDEQNTEMHKENNNEFEVSENTNEEDSEVPILETESINEIDEEKNISVFKVDKDLIVESLSFKDKKNLAKIITSLSMNDYALIIESVKNDGELECVKKVNLILEERLDKEEYELIKEILGEYINLEIL